MLFQSLNFIVLIILINVTFSYQLDKGKNLALGKPTLQSSVVEGGISSRAVDGNRHPDYSEKSCIQTDNQVESWWRVDLQDDYYVTSVVITNRRDCCSERLYNFEIKVGDNNIGGGVINARCSPISQRLLDPGETLEIVCEEPLRGRYVSVIIPTNYGILNFCEVEVYGKKASSVLRLEMTSNGVAEAGPSRNIYSKLLANDKIKTFKDPGIYFTLYDIRTGELRYDVYLNTWTEKSSEAQMVNVTSNVSPETIVCMVLYYSGERYYKAAVPYLEKLVGQPIKADLQYGESWALLGYKGTHSPIPHWRESVRRKIGQGPSKISKLVTLKKAPTGPPSSVKPVYKDGTSIKLTWSRPNDYLTDYDYPFNYSLCISNKLTQTCGLVTDNGLQYTFKGLQPLTNYSITIYAQSANMSGEAFNLTTSTTKPQASQINVKLISRLREDALYRVDGQSYSSVSVAGQEYTFKRFGHNFLALDAKTGNVIQQRSFNTFRDRLNSGPKMKEFLTSLPNKVIILMVVYYRGHQYYASAADSLTAVCPHAPSVLQEDESNALICLKGMGFASWIKSKISTYSLGPAVLETDILLPEDLLTYPNITKIRPSTTSVAIEWLPANTDKFTGSISKYEFCYSGDFNTSGCLEIGADSTQWNVTELHPHVEYELKIKAAALLGYGPFSPLKYVTTLEAAPSGPPTNLRIIFANSTSIIAAWSSPELILQNGIIQNYNVCVRTYTMTSRCEDVVLPASQESYLASNLAPYTVYDVIVSAATSVGYGPSMLVIGKTLEAAPSGPPTNFRVTFVNSSSMTVTWTPPEEELRNGVIQAYKVCVRSFKITDQCKDTILTGSQRNYTAFNLAPFTVYDVIVSAATSVGYGPSVFVTNRTSEAAPSSSPLSFMVSSVNSTQLNLTWDEPNPDDHNGILTEYHLTLLPEPWSLTSKRTITLPRDHVSYLATDLKPYVNYVIEIRAGTQAGLGPAAVLNARTLMEAPFGPPTFVQVKNVTGTTFQVAWSPPAREKQNGVIISYFLCIRAFGVLYACNDTRTLPGTQSQQLFTELQPDREYLVEIKAATKIGYGPSAFVQKMAGKCDNALLDDRNKIENFQFSASGHVSDGHEAFQARFSNLQIWCEDGAKKDAFIQVDIGGLIRIIAVATRGDISHFNAWVTSYKVLYSANDASWTSVTVSGKENIEGNTGAEVVKHYLDEPVLTRYIRFEVVSFFGPHQCMRIEIYGCSPAVSPDSISIVSSNATSLVVAWKPSTITDKNGDIQGYVICPKETSLVTCRNNKTYAEDYERTKWIGNLKPYTEYVIEIASYNVAGEGSPISLVHRTKQAAPSSGPETIDVLATTTNSIRLYWTKVPEKSRNGIITKYSLCYQEHELDHSCSSFQDIPSGSRNFILSDLQPFKEYSILIRAATVIGWGPSTTIRHWTLSAPPSGGPTTVFIKRLGPTVLEITWLPPEVEKRNGIIVSYRLCAKEVSESNPCHNNVIVGGTERRLPIAGLKPFTWYTVSVEAGTTGGYGPPTEFHHRTGEWVPSGTPAEISVPKFNETSITVAWKSPDENEINGILSSYKIEIYEQLDSGYLKMITNTTVASTVSTWTFGSLKKKTEYIIEIKAGTAIGFGPPSVVHQRTSGEADVTYVKKSNKLYLALAKAGIAAGGLSLLAVIGFAVFISLLVTGYVPYTSPWRKRRREIWRQKVKKQQEEREQCSSDSEESDFNSSFSGRGSGSSDDDSDVSNGKKSSRKKKKKQKSSKKSKTSVDKNGTKRDSYDESLSESIDDPHNISVPLRNPKPEEIYDQAALLNAYAKSVVDMCSIYGGSIYSTRPENIYGNILRPENIYGNALGRNTPQPENIYGGNNLRPDRSMGNILPPENIYGNTSMLGSIARPENVYGGNNLPPENIYGNLLVGNMITSENIYGSQSMGQPENIYGVMQEEIYGPAVNTLSVHNYPGGVTSQNLYSTHY